MKLPASIDAQKPIKHDRSNRTGLDRAYLPELDSLRFFAFLLVFGFHHGLPNLGGLIRDLCSMTIDLPILLLFGSSGIGSRLGTAIDHAFTANGWIGVNLFFTLSGFIITRLLLKEELNYEHIDWRAFWFRRILRIWPLYYVIFLIGFAGVSYRGNTIITGVGFSSIQMPLFALFMGNWSMVRHGPIGSDVLSVLWSVCVEEQFYLVIPIALAVTGQRGRFLFCVLGIIAAVYRRWHLAGLGVEQYKIVYDSLAQMDSILAGVLLALLLQINQFRALIEKICAKYLVWAILPASVFALSRRHLGHDEPIRRVFDPLLLCLLSASWVMVAATARGRWAKFLARPELVFLGQISYGLYMWHEVLLTTMGGGFFTLMAVIATAWVSYQIIEKPALRLKKRWARVESRPV